MQSQIECPSCRQVTKKRIEELPKNRLIVQFLELNQSQSSNESRNSPQASPIFNPYQPSVPMPNTRPSIPVPQIPIFHDFNTSQNLNAHRNQSHDFSNNNSGFSRPDINTPVHNHNNQNQNSNSLVWDDRKYFREIFNDIDHNYDGKINFSELHEALIRGNINLNFVLHDQI